MESSEQHKSEKHRGQLCLPLGQTCVKTKIPVCIFKAIPSVFVFHAQVLLPLTYTDDTFRVQCELEEIIAPAFRISSSAFTVFSLFNFPPLHPHITLTSLKPFLCDSHSRDGTRINREPLRRHANFVCPLSFLHLSSLLLSPPMSPCLSPASSAFT